MLKKTGLPKWSFRNIRDVAIFVGLYHPIDYIKFLIHRGPKMVFWCGSDILQLSNHWTFWIKREKAIHFCENIIEELELIKKGIPSHIKPSFFGGADKYQISYKCQPNPKVFMCVHKSREDEYGLSTLENEIAPKVPDVFFYVYGIDKPSHHNIQYKGFVPNEQFDREISGYQCGLRLNKFDGFSEVTAKSILLGQYPITRVQYPRIDYAPTIAKTIELLKKLKNRGHANKEASYHWRGKLTNFLQ